jgi:hypothetical protein
VEAEAEIEAKEVFPYVQVHSMSHRFLELYLTHTLPELTERIAIRPYTLRPYPITYLFLFLIILVY